MSAAPRPKLDPPRDLTIPDPGSSTARQILSLALRRTVRELLTLKPGIVVRPEARGQLRRFLDLVRSLASTNPGAVASLVRHPTVGVFVRCLRPYRQGIGARATEPLLSGLAATACLDLAFAGALPGPIRLDVLPPRAVSLPSRRMLTFPRSTVAATFENGAVALEHPGGRIELVALGGDSPHLTSPFHDLDDGCVLALADDNPLAQEEAHPEKSGNAVSLGERPVDEWVAALRAALELIETHLPEIRAEMRLHLQQIFPVGYEARRHLSASYQAALGTVYMTLHPHVMTLVEALIHEFSHNKLNSLFEVDDVLENAFHPLYVSPVRPDPRPLHGIILAVHAFVPVARIYERMAETQHPLSRAPEFARRYAKIARGNHAGTAVLLEHGRPTRVGTGLLDELARWDDHFRPARKDEGDAVLYVD